MQVLDRRRDWRHDYARKGRDGMLLVVRESLNWGRELGQRKLAVIVLLLVLLLLLLLLLRRRGQRQ